LTVGDNLGLLLRCGNHGGKLLTRLSD